MGGQNYIFLGGDNVDGEKKICRFPSPPRSLYNKERSDVMKRINKTFLMKRLWKQVGMDLLAATKETMIVIKEGVSEIKQSVKERMKRR